METSDTVGHAKLSAAHANLEAELRVQEVLDKMEGTWSVEERTCRPAPPSASWRSAAQPCSGP